MTMDKVGDVWKMERMFPPGKNTFVFLLLNGHTYQPVTYAFDLDKDVMGAEYCILLYSLLFIYCFNIINSNSWFA